MRSFGVLLFALACAVVKGFHISWLTAPRVQYNTRYDTRDDGIVPPWQPPQPPRPPPAVIAPEPSAWNSPYDSYLLDNRVCSKMYCEKRPCCDSLLCVRIGSTKLCLDMSKANRGPSPYR